MGEPGQGRQHEAGMISSVAEGPGVERVNADGRRRADREGNPWQLAPDEAIAAGDDRTERPERRLGEELPEPLLLDRALARVLMRGAGKAESEHAAEEQDVGEEAVEQQVGKRP